MITYKKLTVEEAKAVYNQYLIKDFPPAEVKSFKLIASVMKRDQYRCYGFYEDGAFTGYAFLCDDKLHSVSLMDYYAILEERRGCGCGQRIVKVLEEIHKEYDYILLESEHPDYADNEEELKIRNRRLRFYEKCGMVDAGFWGNTFDVEYKVLKRVCKREVSPKETRKKMLEIYRDLVGEPGFTEKVHLYDV